MPKLIFFTFYEAAPTFYRPPCYVADAATDSLELAASTWPGRAVEVARPRGVGTFAGGLEAAFVHCALASARCRNGVSVNVSCLGRTRARWGRGAGSAAWDAWSTWGRLIRVGEGGGSFYGDFSWWVAMRSFDGESRWCSMDLAVCHVLDGGRLPLFFWPLPSVGWGPAAAWERDLLLVCQEYNVTPGVSRVPIISHVSSISRVPSTSQPRVWTT